MITPLSAAFSNLINRGYVNELKTWDGCFQIRKKRGLNSISLFSFKIQLMRHKLLNLLILTLLSYSILAQSANSFSSVIPYTGKYAYGNNLGYYGAHLTNKNIAYLAYESGARSTRPSIPDWLINGFGETAKPLDELKYYVDTLKMKDLTVFVGGANDPSFYGNSGPANYDPNTYNSAPSHSKLFAGLYEDIWLDVNETQINPNNKYAAYLHQVVTNYGAYIKFYEIVNEPDFTYTSNGWIDASNPTSWWNVDPPAQDLFNTFAPIYHYIRMLRISWSVIKKLQPNSYVCVGGIGYPSYLDALLRNTDNPSNGDVSVQYPLKGGAYFDVLSFHNYPMYHLSYWDNSCSCVKYKRHSDGCVDSQLDFITQYNNLLNSYGYNGVTYPKKLLHSTEVDIAREPAQGEWGAQQAANNFIIKVHVMNQVNNVVQQYKYGMGDGADANGIFNKMGVYYDLTPSSITIYNAQKTQQWYATRTLTSILYGTTYDAVKTTQLNLPPSIRGAAFKDSTNNYVYVLWAKTTIDSSEVASANYTFPFPLTGIKREWDWSLTNSQTTVSQTVTLTGNPSFIISAGNILSITTTTTSQPRTTVSRVSFTKIQNRVLITGENIQYFAKASLYTMSGQLVDTREFSFTRNGMYIMPHLQKATYIIVIQVRNRKGTIYSYSNKITNLW